MVNGTKVAELDMESVFDGGNVKLSKERKWKQRTKGRKGKVGKENGTEKGRKEKRHGQRVRRRRTPSPNLEALGMGVGIEIEFLKNSLNATNGRIREGKVKSLGHRTRKCLALGRAD